MPENWERTYFEWMENIQPWCISRQLWWGHQIPAWYGPDGKVFVAETEEEAVGHALGYYVEQGAITAEQGREMALDRNKRADFIKRDEDVLDTWFSSALWPFSTLGWPDDTPEVKRYYPTDVLVTGFDIIFFWVARMMMMGLHFMKEAPFSTVYIHRLVRDEKGAKMSKSKGNVIDPLGVIDDYGADALRFALARGAAQGHDIKLSPQMVETNRNFATKLWNACRFAEMNDCVKPDGFDPAQDKGHAEPLDRARDGARHARGDGGAGGLSLQRRVQRNLSFRLERLLRLVSRALQADAARRGGRGQGRDPRHGRLGARRDPEAAAPLHALHHRRAVGGDGPPRHAAGAVAVVAQGGRDAGTGADGGRDTERADVPPMLPSPPISPTRPPRPRSAGWSISSPRSARCARR